MITTIRRKNRHEAEQAVSDLLVRGWELFYPLTEIKSSGTEKGEYNHRKGRYTSRVGTSTSCWVARMTKERNR